MSATDKPIRFKLVRDIWSELKKVTWLSRREALYLTGLVLVFSAAVGAVLGGLDYLFSYLVRRFFVGG
ncbi:MAG: preprotein translocase subunit SecE [Dehalococcoidia bacterium]|nr:preprotein translocase subunit SecE [Dehalococcoidia bacterium]